MSSAPRPEVLRHHPGIPVKPIIIPGSDRLFDRHQPGIVIAIIPESRSASSRNFDHHHPGTLIGMARNTH